MGKNSKDIDFTIIVSKLAPAAAVSLSFPAPDLNWYVLQKLLPERPCGCASLAAYSEYTALVYSIYDDVRDKLIGTPDNQMKSKVASITCGYQNGEFIISYVCQGSITAIRKSLGMCISRLAPHKVYPKYTKYIKLLGGKPHRDEFLNCANRLAHTMKASIVVVGKVNTSAEKEDAVVSVISKKMPDLSGIDKGTAPASEKETRGTTEYSEIKINDYNIFFVRDYLDSINMLALQTGNSIIVYDKKWSKANADSIDKYVTTKFSKLGDKLLPVVLYSACSRGLLHGTALKQLNSSKLTSGAISKSLKSILV
jgi:hypothetical protein